MVAGLGTRKLLLEEADFWLFEVQELSGRLIEEVFEQKKMVTRWFAPEPGCLKLNVDAALCDNSRLVGVGIVIREENGKVVGAMADCFKAEWILMLLNAWQFGEVCYLRRKVVCMLAWWRVTL